MARKNDDLLMEDELNAAFLNDDDTIIEEDLSVPAPTRSRQVEEEDDASEEDEWDVDPESLPGQLAVDVYETEESLVVRARTAGISAEDLDVSVSDNVLTISGILSGGDDVNATRWHIQECYWGEFSRTIPLPVPIKYNEHSELDGDLTDGVLTIVFEKEKTEDRKRVRIRKH